MINQLRYLMTTAEFWFVVILIGFLIALTVLLIENYRDNKQIKQLNQKVNALIEGNYADVLDMRGSPEITDMANSLNDLSEVIRLTHDNLEQEKTRLTSILSYMSDGVIATDRIGRIIMINDMAQKQLGLSNPKQEQYHLLEVLDLSDRYTLRDLLAQTPEIVIDHTNENEEFLTLRANFATIRSESGLISGLVVVLHDMTEQAKEERERRLFVSNVSHELRTPLTSVKSYLEALDEGALTESVAPSFVKVSLDETNRMMRMITDLLSLSRIDNQVGQIDVELINFTAFVTFILNRFDQMKNTDSDKVYTIVRDYQISPIWVEIDTDKMTQVLDNILNNAIKYSPDGGTITFSMKTTDSQLIVSVSDEGLGIPKADLPRIFDRFYRVDKARSRAQGGTGLGLAIAKEIVKQHKGFIWAKSEYGHGSTFTIVLPYSKDIALDEWDDSDEEEEENMIGKGFNYSILASGSSGNCFYLETDKKKILVDAGLSGKKITSLLAEIDRKPEDIDAILVTHEHSDHIHGIGVLARKYGMDIYANELTWQAMESKLGKIDVAQKHIFELGAMKTFGDLDIESFGVSHDAACPQFYRFMKDDKSFVMLTDTGYVSDRMVGIVENADAYLIESNHDIEILRSGSYSWNLKQRILSDKGHLCNEDGADAMIRSLGNRTKKIYLGHLSKENNIKELAHMTMVNQLAQADLGVGVDFQVYDTSPDTATPLTKI
ncbi:TPA: cell wall metabolism sensor histidine kinase VicK [Streptococcus suis]|nr:cell wall metabolism sensor histidine kinase VicK [Streptococcus suis]HEP1800267.1 cell wall metabolism sensor histidine kinase VicK [Streptococcus suis]